MNTKDFYEDLAKKHDAEVVGISHGARRFIAHDDRYETMVSFLNNELNNSKNLEILDVGCGDGVYEKKISPHILERNVFRGLDISNIQLEKCRAVLKDFKAMDFENDSIPYGDNMFDYIICSEVLEHLFYPEKILNEIKRVLKQEGTLIITVPNLGSLQNRIALLFFGTSPFFDYMQNKQHIRFYTKKTILSLLGNDFKIQKQIGINSCMFERYIFPIRIIMPYFFQKLCNKIFPNYGGGLFLVCKKTNV